MKSLLVGVLAGCAPMKWMEKKALDIGGTH